jgi:5-hydroxyisourate hydrolase
MISTHILDTTTGFPAGNVEVCLEKKDGESWEIVATARTNDDGRIAYNNPAEAGDYRLTFKIEEYFAASNREHFFLDSPVIFRITDTNRKYHVPLLINPFGQSTYRGS